MESGENFQPFTNEIRYLAKKFGNSENVHLCPTYYNGNPKLYGTSVMGIYEYGYAMHILRNHKQIRSDILEAFDEGFQFIESIMFIGNTIVFFPKAF